MFKEIIFCSLLAVIQAAPGYLSGHGLGLPVAPAPYITAHAPAVLSAPVIHGPPILSAHVPVLKAVAPAATSYASITNVAIAHPVHVPVVKTIVAPQPIIKSYISAPLTLGHGAPLALGHGYGFH